MGLPLGIRDRAEISETRAKHACSAVPYGALCLFQCSRAGLT